MSVRDKDSVFPMNLLLFKAADCDFGVEASQVSAMSAWDGVDDGELFRLDEALGRPTRSYGPGATVIAIGADAALRALVQEVDAIVEVAAADIRPFPELIESLALRRGMWGIHPRNGRLFLLLDFERIKRRAAHGGTENFLQG